MESQKPVAEPGIRVAVAVLTLLGGLVVVFAAQVSTNIFSTFMPMHVSDGEGLSSSQFVTLSLIRLVTMIVTAPLFGYYGDRAGRRRLALIGVFVLGISIIAVGQMTGFPALALGYFVSAIGASMVLTSLLALMFKAIGTHWLLAFVAALYVTTAQVASSGFVAGALLIEQFGFKTGLTISGLVIVAVGTFGLGFVGLAYLLIRRASWLDEWLDSSRSKPQWASISLALLAVFLIRWTCSTESLIAVYATTDLGLQMAEVSVAIGAISVVLAAIAFLIPPAGLLADLLDYLTRRFAGRQFGRQSIVALGVLILCIGFGILLFAKDTQGVAGSLLAMRLGSALLGPSLLAVVIAYAPNRLWGTVTGLYLAATAAGELGNVGSGFAADRWGWTSTFVLGIVLAALALVLVAVALKAEKERRRFPPRGGAAPRTFDEVGEPQGF